MKWAKPQEWNSGAAMNVVCARFSGILDSSDTAGSSDCGCAAAAPFGVPVVPEVRITARPARARAAPAGSGRRAGDQLVERGVVGVLGVVPGDEALAPLAGVLEQLGELLVVDDRHRLLALDDLRELRAGEGGVQVERVGAELGERDRRLDEAAVVAAHDRDAVALADAGVGERVRERVGAAVDLARR